MYCILKYISYIADELNDKTMTTVVYYITGEARQTRSFNTPGEARAFTSALHENPNCESYRIVRS
jgi:hypothetical protein